MQHLTFLISLLISGETTDTDVQLGRPQSETIYYIVKSIGKQRQKFAVSISSFSIGKEKLT